MKTVTVLPVPTLPYKSKVKQFLTAGIIYLISQNFSIFATVIAALIEYIGVLLDNEHIVTYGAIVFLIGLTPWSIRETSRDLKQEKLGLHNNKW